MPFAPLPWLQRGLAAAWVVHRVDGESFEALVRTAVANYRGPNPGGLDLMPPNANGDAWVFTGRWTDAMTSEVAEVARALEACLQAAAEIVRGGVLAAGQGSVDVRAPAPSPALDVAPLEYAVGVIPVAWWTFDAALFAALEERVFPSIPRFVGRHMGMPHWLGIGMDRRDGRIASFSSYARLATVPERGIELSAMGERGELDAFLAALGRATGWFPVD